MEIEKLKDEEILLLKTGMSDNTNLLDEDEMGEIFGGYKCVKLYVNCLSQYNICTKNF